MTYIDDDRKFIIKTSKIEKLNNELEKYLCNNKIHICDFRIHNNMMYVSFTSSNGSYDQYIDYDNIIEFFFSVDQNATIFSYNVTGNEDCYSKSYHKYFFDNKIYHEYFESECIIPDSIKKELDETLEEYLIKNYLSMVEYVQNIEKVEYDMYGEYKCNCLFCGYAECQIYESDKEQFNFLLEGNCYNCYACDNYDLNLIELHMKLKNITYQEAVSELFNILSNKFIPNNTLEHEDILKEIRNIIQEDEYQLNRYDEYYDKKARNIEKKEMENKNAKNSYIKEEWIKNFEDILNT